MVEKKYNSIKKLKGNLKNEYMFGRIEQFAIELLCLYLYDIYGIIGEILLNVSVEHSSIYNLNKIVLDILECTNYDNFIIRIEKLEKALKAIERDSEYFELKSNELNYILRFIKFIIMNGKTIGVNQLSLPLFSYYDNKVISSDELGTMIDLYEKSNLLKRFISFDYSSLSTGEKNLLVFYSRLYEVISNNKYANKLNDNIILLLDEPDVTFHPEWSRRFIDSLITFLEDIFGKDKNIKVIITTHSPFIVSDIPTDKIIFLEYDKDALEREIIYKSNYEEQTFASNIHDLFSKSFFLEYTLGEFSRKKIIEIVNILQDKELELNEEEQDRISKTIDLIGEPILKGKLQQLYFEKIKTENNIDKEIKLLEEKINELKRQKNLGDYYDKD